MRIIYAVYDRPLGNGSEFGAYVADACEQASGTTDVVKIAIPACGITLTVAAPVEANPVAMAAERAAVEAAPQGEAGEAPAGEPEAGADDPATAPQP